ncbi:MAG TPA: SRPBCC domain-containing protein [Polyangiaceae bacterium]|nr:SRPBCC domain-containing protein [Polyangiaceae bacterium]
MTLSIEVRRSIDAAPDTLWAACGHPAGIARWQADQAEGDVVRGGRLSLSWPALGAHVELDVVEATYPHRLVLRNGETHVTFDLSPGQVAITQNGVHSPDEAAALRSSWALSLSLLDHQLRHHATASRQVDWFLARARTTAEAAHVFFTNEAALRTWLTQSGGVGPEGSACSLALSWGARLNGRVLSLGEGRDVALSWDDQGQSVLVMRTLPSPRSPDERLVALSWSRWGTTDPGTAVVTGLSGAVVRLQAALTSSGLA